MYIAGEQAKLLLQKNSDSSRVIVSHYIPDHEAMLIIQSFPASVSPSTPSTQSSIDFSVNEIGMQDPPSDTTLFTSGPPIPTQKSRGKGVSGNNTPLQKSMQSECPSVITSNCATPSYSPKLSSSTDICTPCILQPSLYSDQLYNVAKFGRLTRDPINMISSRKPGHEATLQESNCIQDPHDTLRPSSENLSLTSHDVEVHKIESELTPNLTGTLVTDGCTESDKLHDNTQIPIEEYIRVVKKGVHPRVALESPTAILYAVSEGDKHQKKRQPNFFQPQTRKFQREDPGLAAVFGKKYENPLERWWHNSRLPPKS